ncbi:V-type ATP synthase subunit I, partial [[Clostridium] scindens]|nr:V-type ATP synthase subunit I [[Clostridium] scindens]
ISLVGGGAYQLLSGVSVITNPVFAIVFLLVPLVLIFLKEALERIMEKKEMFPDGFGGFFVESFFELFEI